MAGEVTNPANEDDMNYAQTRDVLIAAGIDPARLPDEWKWRIDLRRADLSGANLSGANLSGANLSGANLSSANLSSANLYGADLYGANLSGANLSSAYLSGANLSSANLSSANLSSANLYGAKLSDANLSRAIINWNSHDLLAEIARRAAGDDLRQRMTAGVILISRDWCWEKFVAVFDRDTKDWLGSIFAPYAKDDDNAPDIVRQYVGK